MSSPTTPVTETIDPDHYLSVMQSESDNESSEDVACQQSIKKHDSANQVDIQTENNSHSHSKINESIKDLERFIDELLNRPGTSENSAGTQQSIHLLYERIIYELKSEIKLLRDVNETTEGVLKDEIEYLRGELNQRNHLISTLVLTPNSIPSDEKIIVGEPNNENIVLQQPNKDKILLAQVNDEKKNIDINQFENETKDIETQTSTNLFTSKDENKNVCLELNDSPPPPNTVSNTDNSIKFTENETQNNNRLIADTIICNLYPRKSSKYKDVSIKNFPGSSTEEIYEYIKNSLKRKPTDILVHVGINDITLGTNTMENLHRIASLVNDNSPKTKLSFSSVVLGNRFKTMVEQMNELYSELEEFCKTNNFGFVDNTNLDESCLDFKTLHLNSKGDGLLSRNILRYLRKAAVTSPPSRSKKKHRVTISCLGI